MEYGIRKGFIKVREGPEKQWSVNGGQFKSKHFAGAEIARWRVTEI
jgi:hypothetical protein